MSKQIDVTGIKPVDVAPFSLEKGSYDLATTVEETVGQNDFPVLTNGDLGSKWLGINKVVGLIHKQKATSLISEDNGRQILTLPSPCKLVVTNKGAMTLSL